MGQSMYYTDNEPPMELLGSKRHFFGKPSAKAMSSHNQSAVKLDSSPTLDTGKGESMAALSKIAGAGLAH